MLEGFKTRGATGAERSNSSPVNVAHCLVADDDDASGAWMHVLSH